MPVARLQTAQTNAAGGILIRTSPGQTESVDIMFLDGEGADLSQADQRKLERIFSRGEFRRAFPGEIGDLMFPPRVFEAYTLEMLRVIDVSGLAENRLKVVVDTGGGSASLVLPRTARSARGRRAHGEQRPRRGVTRPRPRPSGPRHCAGSAAWSGSSQGGLRCPLRPGGGAHRPRRREGRHDRRRPGAARGPGPRRRRGAGWPGGAAGHHHPGRRAGRGVPRGRDRVDRHDTRRADRGGRRAGRRLRR